MPVLTLTISRAALLHAFIVLLEELLNFDRRRLFEPLELYLVQDQWALVQRRDKTIVHHDLIYNHRLHYPVMEGTSKRGEYVSRHVRSGGLA